MSTETMMVHRDQQPIYPIWFADTFEGLEEAVLPLSLSERRVCIVTDSHVAELYLEQVEQMAQKFSYRVFSFVFPAGEKHKTLDTVKDLYKFLIHHSFDRKDVLFALGGGVVGDLTGFAASTYLRGIRFIQIPTTLLSQVDSSIGGKTGVDFDAYKNMVGAFYMPKLVYINVSVLQSLPTEQFASGMGEVIKHGCIQSVDYYRWISEHREAIRRRDMSALKEMVKGSCLIKRAVVEEDPTEQGIRAFLNLGHTLGHAIEKEKLFTMSHGACVGVGCTAAVWLSVKRGMLLPKELRALEDLLSYFDLPTRVSDLSVDDSLEAVKHDKKMDSGVVRFILLKAMGEACIDRTVTEDEMREALFYVAGV